MVVVTERRISRENKASLLAEVNIGFIRLL
jgi:hypothetical protein